MRTVIVDQFEFESHSTEECVEIASARRTEFPNPDLASFAGAFGVGPDLPQAVPLDELSGCQEVIEDLRTHAGIDVPAPCSWPCRELPNGLDGRHLLLETDDGFISYKWSTSA
jgi:hypothetical protein